MKKIQTTLPIDILTDYEHAGDDKNESARQQIEHAGLYLQSIFNTIKRSALHTDGEFSNVESDTVRNFCGDLIHFSEIGNALLMLIWKNISDIGDRQPKTIAENDIEKPAALVLAERLSALALDEQVPPPIRDGIEQTLNDFFNEHIAQETLNAKTLSPEYIREMLENSDYFEAGGAATI